MSMDFEFDETLEKKMVALKLDVGYHVENNLVFKVRQITNNVNNK